MRRTAAFLLLGLACSPRFAAQPPDAPYLLTGSGPVRELRLGVVCYGGVSLSGAIAERILTELQSCVDSPNGAACRSVRA